MKNKIIGMLLVSILAVSGCTQGKSPEPENVKNESTVDEQDKESAERPDEEAPDEEASEDVGEPAPEEHTISLYYVDDATGEIAQKETTVTGDLGTGVCKALKEAKVLSEECDVISTFVNEEEKKMDLDVNSGFGEYVRGMGTTGSTQVIDCVVKTYLSAYGCEGLKLTENGNVFDTGHTSLEDYMK